MNADKRVRLEPLLSFDRRSGTAASLSLLFALDGDLLGVFASLPGFSPQPLPGEDWRPRLTRAGSVFFQKPTPVGIEKAFTMPISQALLEIVPVGEENAVSGRLLWKQLGMWSAESIKHKLNQLAAEGLIERRRIVDRSRETSLYFRVRT